MLIFIGGKRSVEMGDYEEDPTEMEIPQPEPKPLKHHPIPFDINLHGHRYRRTPCNTQYVLFLLDTSGSIGPVNFCDVTCELSNLVQWFCSPVQLAVMTFSDTFHEEFCFGEYSNTCNGRRSAKAAMKRIGYRGGNTHSGRALRCAFDEMLVGDCGFPGNHECLSVVFITDGWSNGPSPLCDVAADLKTSYPSTSFFSIGIGNANEAELRCLATNYDDTHLFQYSNFDKFKEELNSLNTIFHIYPRGFSCAHAMFDDTDEPLGRVDCPEIGQRDTC